MAIERKCFYELLIFSTNKGAFGSSVVLGALSIAQKIIKPVIPLRSTHCMAPIKI